MKAKITQFTLVVNNKQAALDFYTNKVGFEKKTDVTGPNGYRYVTVGPQGQDLELPLWEAGTSDPTTGSPTKWRPGNNPPIFMIVDNCREVFDELKSRGVQFKQEKPDENPWTFTATFSDPDGNLFSINQFRSPASQAK
jgi:predicted enzyme related to lactoylglutathione lyase